MLIVPRFYHIPRRSWAKIVAASEHPEVKKIVLPDPYLVGRGLTALPKNPTHLGLLGLGLPFALLWQKSCNTPWAKQQGPTIFY